MKKVLSIIIAAVVLISVLPVSHVSAYVTGTVGQYNAISAGEDHSMAVKADGTLWAFGSIRFGQLGTDMRWDTLPSMGYAMQAAPDKVMDDVVSVSAGNGFTMAIKRDHTLWAWGSNASYELGNDGKGNKILESYGGYSYPYQSVPTKIMDDVEAVCAGFDCTMAIKTDHTLWAWGYNYSGQFGNNEIGNYKDSLNRRIQTTPVKIMDDVASVNTAFKVTMIIKTDGTLWACGDNTYGQIGNGGSETQNTPVKIMDDVVSVSTSGYHTLAIKTDGSLWAWGRNLYYELGNGKGGYTLKKYEKDDYYVQDPICERWPVKIMDDVASVSAGDGYTMVIKNDGTLWAWGCNDVGQLGNGGEGDTVMDEFVIQANPVKIMDNVASVSAGDEHVLAVTMDGTLWTWGLNESRQLGHGRATNFKKWGDPYCTVPSKVLSGVYTDKAVADPSTSTVLVDGKKISFDVYNINYNNYFKLRDLAAALSGSGKQFDVIWDKTNEVINLLTEKPYTIMGGELAAGSGQSKIVALNKSKIYIDGAPVTFQAYTINGNNYFKLRDVAKVINFGVEWDEKTNTIVIDTSKDYVE